MINVAINIEFLERKYFPKNKPIPYKLKCNVELLIYPVILEDYDIFEESFDVLTIEKNEIPIPEIIQMSYLQFIFEILLKKEQLDYGHKLLNIMELCLKENDIIPYYENNKPVLLIRNNDILKAKITAKEFDDIKRIILYQNIVGYDDTMISADIKKMINLYNKTNNNNIQQPNLEDKMAFLGNETGLSYEQILKMTYREFQTRFNWAIQKVDYMINKTAEMSGNVKFNKPIEHLIYKSKKHKFERFFSDKEDFVNKIQNA